jgi:transcriptional regulator with XRE-family HTH domain
VCRIFFKSLWWPREERLLKLPRLREVRQLRGWSQGVLAEKADVSRDSISNYETGHREAYPATARKLADALGVAIADLIEEAGQSLLETAQDAARQDEKKVAQAVNRLFASEGELRATSIAEYEEDRFRAELRARGFPDEYFENFIWPLVTTVNQQEREISRLREELKNSRLREEQESVHR